LLPQVVGETFLLLSLNSIPTKHCQEYCFHPSTCACAAAVQVVGETFLLLEAAWQDAGQRARFLQLPREALERLLASPALQVASENTAFIAVATWLSAQLK
jgi:hypothetical protein